MSLGVEGLGGQTTAAEVVRYKSLGESNVVRGHKLRGYVTCELEVFARFGIGYFTRKTESGVKGLQRLHL